MRKTGVLVGAMAIMALITAVGVLALASRARTYDSLAAFSAAYPEAVVTVSPDGRKAVTQYPYGGMLPIWDADSRRVTTIYAVYGTGDSVAFSPDGRYLVITGAMLRVYDLNAPQSADRGPTYRLPSGEGWRFVDAHTIEIADGASLRRVDLAAGR